jgi:hypothetical protein
MTSRVTEIIIDSHEPLSLARWWAEVLDYEVAPPAPQGWVGITPREGRPSEEAYRAAPRCRPSCSSRCWRRSPSRIAPI